MKTSLFSCGYDNCKSTFTRRYDLKRHMIKLHGVSDVSHSGNCLCIQCGHRFHKIKDLRKHLNQSHNIEFRIEFLNFDNKASFDSWKCQLEEEKGSSYVKTQGDVIGKDGSKTKYWQCNRCDIYKSRRTGKRRIKSSGTCKIEKNCTSTIKEVTNSDEKVKVEVCYTHYGHSQDYHHTWITKRQRQEIASKLQQGVTRRKILDDIRDDIGSKFQRIHLLENRDILNIGRAFGLQEVQRHANDQMSVLSWIQEWEQLDKTPILFYKLQGQASSQHEFKDEDFIIVIQTEAQKEMLEKFGSNGLCCDSTHGTTGYNFLLISLLIMDEFGQGHPIAWCLANHENESFVKVFFKKIKNEVGTIQPKWFMTDLAPQFYNAFCEVFNLQPKWLYCAWHVDKAWKEELRKKIKNFEIETVVYKMLRTVLEETNEILFQDKLSSLINRLESHATSEFKAYFLKYWICVTKSWAYCYRVGEGINTNMFVEAFHRTFKYNYLKGKCNKRVDTVLVNLLKFSRDKLFSRLIKLTKGSLTQRMQNIYDRHLSSKKMSYTAINKTSDENVFLINSEDGQNKYVATRLSDKCNTVGCRLQCITCFVCTHTFHCNCSDFLIKNTLCKHVHLLKDFLAVNNKVDDKAKNSVELQDGYSYNEINSIKCNLEKLHKVSKFEETKSKTVNLLHTLMHRVNNCSNLDIEALKYIGKQITTTINTFDAMSKYHSVKEIKTSSLVASNKRIKPQTNFVSTKKKRKEKTNVRFCKPTTYEKESIFRTEKLNNNEDEKSLSTVDGVTHKSCSNKLATIGISTINLTIPNISVNIA